MDQKHRTGPSDAAGVSCGKCGAVNTEGRRTCSACGSHLHIVCKKCGTRNIRSEPSCSNCHQSLHRNIWDRSMSRIRKEKDKHTSRLALVTVCLIAIIVVVWLVVQLAKDGDGMTKPYVRTSPPALVG